jgi:hypothetical protein
VYLPLPKSVPAMVSPPHLSPQKDLPSRAVAAMAQGHLGPVMEIGRSIWRLRELGQVIVQ